jgi:hypothetical protein
MIQELNDQKRMQPKAKLYAVEVLSLRVSRLGGYVSYKVKEYDQRGMLRRIAGSGGAL